MTKKRLPGPAKKSASGSTKPPAGADGRSPLLGGSHLGVGRQSTCESRTSFFFSMKKKLFANRDYNGSVKNLALIDTENDIVFMNWTLTTRYKRLPI